jgi:signal transduction histidine kinase
MPRRALRRIGTGSAVISIAAWFALVALGLIGAALLQFRATYVEQFEQFAANALQRAQLQSQWAAARIEPVLPELLARRMPSREGPWRDTAQILLDALGEQPPSIDTLAIRVGDIGHLVPDTWRSTPGPQASSCIAGPHENLVWLAHRVLWLDLCARITATLQQNPGSAVEGQQLLLLLRTLSTRDQTGVAVLETRHAFNAMLAEWAPQSAAYWLGLGVQLVTIAALGSFGWLMFIRRLRRTEHNLRAAPNPDALWIPPRANRALDEVGRIEHTVRNTLRGVAVHQLRLQHKNEILERLRRFIAHEIRTPLQSLMAMNAHSEHALSYLKRIKYAVDEVLEDASSEYMRDIEEKDLCGFVHRWVESLKAYRDEQLIAFSAPQVPCPVRLSFEALEDTLDHLYSNAHDFRRAGSHIEVRVGLNPPYGTITVRNLGPQIPEHMLPLIFNYGVTTRGHDAQHLGQGLFRVNSLVARMHGSVRAQNVPDGVEFTITLPLLGSATLV